MCVRACVSVFMYLRVVCVWLCACVCLCALTRACMGVWDVYVCAVVQPRHCLAGLFCNE